MRVVFGISAYMIPMVVLGIIVIGIYRKVDVYSAFIKGANEGFSMVIQIMPTLIALMIAVGILRSSGFLDYVGHFFEKIMNDRIFPSELVPLTVVKMFSSSAATGLLLDLYKEYGTDSRIGWIASITMCCTETIFYTMSVYYMTAKVKKSRYTLAGALLATLAGLVASVCLGNYHFR